ncbi:MAG: hypothetical protein V1735_00710 [Nanoarchaeota archaeon]
MVKILLFSDFCGTQTPNTAQTPILQANGIDEAEFYAEGVRHLGQGKAAHPGAAYETVYLWHLLRMMESGALPRYSRRQLTAFGAEINLFPGSPGFVEGLRGEADDIGDELGFYILSSGLSDTIAGSAIGQESDGIFASVLEPAGNEDPLDGKVARVASAVGEQAKADYLDGIISLEQPARVFYICDGMSDGRVMDRVLFSGGQNFFVFNPERQGDLTKAADLHRQGIVLGVHEADYSPGSRLYRALNAAIHS